MHMHIIIKILHFTLTMSIQYIVKLIVIVANFNGILHVRQYISGQKSE